MKFRILLLATAMALALAAPAKADIVQLGGLNWDTSTGVILQLGGVPSGNQPNNNPCIICGANQPNQTNFALGFGYTDYGNQGNQTTETYFSSGVLRDLLLGTDTISLTNYSGLQLKNLITALGGQNAFSIGVDMNQANGQGPQTLESFFFLDLSSHTILAAFSPGPGGVDLPSINNGTGFPDYLLNGLTTLNLVDTDQYAFYARLTNANDGPDSFFIVPAIAAVPGPIAGAGLPGLIAACMMLLGLGKYRRRRNNLAA